MARPAGTARIPVQMARATPRPSCERSPVSRTGTWLPATSMTNAKPADARNSSTGSSGVTQPSPARPTTAPARISPTTTGTRQREGVARSGPARPIASTSARPASVIPSLPLAARAAGAPTLPAGLLGREQSLVHRGLEVRVVLLVLVGGGDSEV